MEEQIYPEGFTQEDIDSVGGHEVQEPTEEPAGRAEPESAAEPAPTLEELQAKVDELSRHESGLRSALTSERFRARQKLEEQQRAFDQRFGILQEKFQEWQNRKEEDTYRDPAEVAQEKIDNLSNQVSQIGQTLNDSQRQALIQQQWQQFRGVVMADVQAFRESTEDYDQAVSFLQQNTARYLEAQGVPREQIPAQLERMEAQIAHNSLSIGESPARRYYEMAKGMGWKPTPQTPPAASKPQSLSQQGMGGGGSPGQGSMTIDRFLSMPLEDLSAISGDESFEAVLRQMGMV